MSVSFSAATQSDPAHMKPNAGAVRGSVAVLLRAEAAAELLLAVLAYQRMGSGWWVFAALALVPDLSMVGYLVSRSVGTWLYNLFHTYLAPALLGAAGRALGMPVCVTLALIWAAHIAFDRLAGYGLKYPAAFRATHLGGAP